MSRSARACFLTRRAVFRSGLWLALLGLGCESRRAEPLGVPSASEPSPNASVLPAPLVKPAPKPEPREGEHLPSATAADGVTAEPPRPIREDDVLASEAELRASPGLALEARLRWLEPPPPRSPEGNSDALARAREKTAFDIALELSPLGRLRVGLGSRAFAFPLGTELRARDDRYGHILVWPRRESYTPLAPGTLRALLSEVRADVAPLADAAVISSGSGSLLGFPTRRQRLETSVGRLELEQATLPAAGSAGTLWCRLLVELLAVAPESTACGTDWVPLRAEYVWTSGARFELEVTKVAKRSELAIDGLLVPPATAAARRGELPELPFVSLLDERELGELRVRALPPANKPDANAPKVGLLFQNRSDAPRYLLVDGVPLVWLRADAEWLVTGLKTGRYTVQARDFFGAEATPARVVELPVRFTVGDDTEKVPHREAPHQFR